MRSSLARLAGLAMLAACGWYAASNLVFVWRHWWRIPSMDQATWQTTYARDGLAGVLFGQFNEHRWIVPAPLYAIDIEWFSATGALVEALLVAAQLGTFALLLVPVLRRGALPAAAACMLGGLFLVWATWLEQCENLCWPLQLHTTLCNLLQVGACWYFARGRMGPAIALGVTATFTFGNGFLLWPALALASALRRRWRLAAIFLGVCVACLAVYSIGYRTPAHHAPALASLSKPLAVAHFFTMFVARPFLPAAIVEQIGPGTPEFLSPGNYPVPPLLALAGLLAFAWLAYRYWQESAPAFDQHFYVPIMALSLGTGLVIAIGRISFGIKAVLASRYVTLELLFWTALLASLGAALFRRRANPVLAVGWGLALAAAAASTIPANREMGLFCRERAAVQKQETLALRMGVYDPDRWRGIAGEVESEMRALLARYERESKLVFATRSIDPVGSAAPDRDAGSGDCKGSIDLVKQVPTSNGVALSILGWAWDSAANSEVDTIVIADPEDRRIAGAGYAGMFRLDVSEQFRAPNMRTTGWLAYTRPLDTVRPMEVWAKTHSGYCLLGVARP